MGAVMLRADPGSSSSDAGADPLAQDHPRERVHKEPCAQAPSPGPFSQQDWGKTS